jgi:hypothetical protein
MSSPDEWNVSPLDVKSERDTGYYCQKARQVAIHDTKEEEPGDERNTRKHGQSRYADPLATASAGRTEAGHEHELSSGRQCGSAAIRADVHRQSSSLR